MLFFQTPYKQPSDKLEIYENKYSQCEQPSFYVTIVYASVCKHVKNKPGKKMKSSAGSLTI